MEEQDSSEEKYREDEGAGTSAQAGEPSEKKITETNNNANSIMAHLSRFYTLGGQSIGVSASKSVLPTNIQD